MLRYIIILVVIYFCLEGKQQVIAQNSIVFPSVTSNEHPRLYIKNSEHQTFYDLTSGGNDFYPFRYRVERRKVDDYVNKHVTDPDWIVGRLQMYWHSKSTIIQVNDGSFVSAGGPAAPVATVRYAGNRDPDSDYNGDLLDSLVEFSDSSKVYLFNKVLNKWEWASPENTGYAIQEINEKILGMAATSSLAYWRTGFDKYAKFSYDIFRTYMYGMYYRSKPENLVNSGSLGYADYGLQAFSVIKDYTSTSAAMCYDFLYNYIRNQPGKTSSEIDAEIAVYEEVFRNWTMWIILHGTSANNWNSIKSNFATHLALCLHDDNTYSNNKGWQYYSNIIFNRDTGLVAGGINHKGLINYLQDYDQQTGAWYESPSYSMLVVDKILNYVHIASNVSGIDLMASPQLAILPKAVKATAQYLFPNKSSTAFGDSESMTISATNLEQMIAYYRKRGNSSAENEFTAMYNMQYSSRSTSDYVGIVKLLTYVNTFNSVAPAKLQQYTSPFVYFPNTSWTMQRNGMDPLHGMGATMVAASGKHFNLNGLSIELSAKGVILAPDAGRGDLSYASTDYTDYYLQNIAHNTVIVDGKATLRRHIELRSNYPVSEQNTAHFPDITYVHANYSELSTGSSQSRLTSIRRTGLSSGYFIDIFRSKKNNNNAAKHEYFYHNVGDLVDLYDTSATPLAIQRTTSTDLSATNGSQAGYTYLTDKKTTVTNTDASGYYNGAINARFKLIYPGKVNTLMDVWVNGESNRKIFTASAPPSHSFSGTEYNNLATKRTPTLVVRQEDEAYTRPFIAVMEAYQESEGKTITNITSFNPLNTTPDFVGLNVKSGVSAAISDDYIFNSDTAINTVFSYGGMLSRGIYSVVSNKAQGYLSLFIGDGYLLSKGDYKISLQSKGAAVFNQTDTGTFVMSTAPMMLRIPDTFTEGTVSFKIIQTGDLINGIRSTINGQAVVEFSLPELEYNKAEFLVLNTLSTGLVNFKALPTGGRSKIEWATGEKDISYFTLERSDDGKDFKLLSTIQNQNSSEFPDKYVFYDYAPFPGNNYYRLSQHNLDETIVEHGIKVLSFEALINPGISVFPNPVINKQLNIRLDNPGNEQALLSLYNTSGMLVQEEKVNFSNGQNYLLRIREDIPTGQYILILSGQKLNKKMKLIIL